jgi:hypothetical protein
MSTTAAEGARTVKPGYRWAVLLPQLPGRLLASLGLVTICGLMYVLLPFSDPSPHLFVALEFIVLAAGVWAFHHVVRRRRIARAWAAGRVTDEDQ